MTNNDYLYLIKKSKFQINIFYFFSKTFFISFSNNILCIIFYENHKSCIERSKKLIKICVYIIKRECF